MNDVKPMEARVRVPEPERSTMPPNLDLETLVLDKGAHESPEHGMCVMEAVAYVAGEPFTDHPECASPILGAFLRGWNDAAPDADRQLLKPYIPQLVGTNTGPADEETRAWMLNDWLARECAPGFLRLAGLTDQAELLEQLAPIVSRETAELAQPALDRARSDAAAAWDAAWDAARDAAWDAAWDAARAAARDAAWDAARDAARAAAWDAAKAAGGGYSEQYDAAYKASRPLIEAKFEPVTSALNASALQLVERMIAVGKTEEQAA